MKKYLIIFHSLLLLAVLTLTFMDLKEMLIITFPPIVLIVLMIIFIVNESKFIVIPTILLVFIVTFVFALMVVGNIVWSNGTVFLVIILYVLFLAAESITIVFALKYFKKQI